MPPVNMLITGENFEKLCKRAQERNLTPEEMINQIIENDFEESRNFGLRP